MQDFIALITLYFSIVIHATYSAFTLANGHGTVQHAYFLQSKLASIQSEVYRAGFTWPCSFKRGGLVQLAVIQENTKDYWKWLFLQNGGTMDRLRNVQTNRVVGRRNNTRSIRRLQKE